ncbi:putative restriction/modification enzyme [Natrinema pellirubrum DSM 15624]|uniref:site-specific DNA-methyltransferase (adenine-specific) n=1 Tax=Natrinema pellirubrum (strain DSM 15624 / CIP 106293 / JCM 10476 / NCIMB 786 / 157) TaxID=797303 RepID=L0JMC0_NATP1|nr:N-6 DNA methylase [Natrinema pellirubrum]AGB32404.1 type I restriction-modification system methyltransferase subunit [Natrinema pellirubrum DSM 15624]ELY73987.1 putative restriction/modification enzyme [Natrinema pellirubrum DSM 15624]
MSQATLSDRPYTNSNLFSGYYLDERIEDREEWDCDAAASEALKELQDLYDLESGLVDGYKEDPLIDNWIDEVLEILGFGTNVETTLPEGGGYVDVLLFEDTEARRDAAEVYLSSEDTTDLFDRGVGLVEAKQWDADFTTRFSDQRPYRNASHQIKHYLERTPERIQWGILTNGRKWRLYGTKDYETQTYYEIDLPELLERGDLEAFKYFYLFFRPAAFRESGGTTFLDSVRSESETVAQELGEDLQDNVFTALRVLGRGFAETNDLAIEPGDDDGLAELKEQSLVLLYRLMFVLYAESRGLIHPEGGDAVAEYEENFSLDELRLEIHEEIGEVDEGFADAYSDHSTTMWSRLEDLFRLIDEGEESLGIPPYNGGLFNRDKHEFLADHEVSNRYLAEVIYRISTTENDEGRYVLADYADLDTRHLGSVYEGLLEHQFRIAPEAYAAVAEDGGQVWKPATEVSVAAAVETVDEGGLYVVNDEGERKATGAYYTPDYVVTYIVEETVGPLVDEIKADLESQGFEPGTHEYLGAFYRRVTDLKLLDPAMGSGHFLTRATEYLAQQVMEEVRELEEATAFDEQRVRRDVAKECIYGVDLNGMAVELAKLSMWLETLAADQPLAFLDHHLKAGNSLVGSDVTEVLSSEHADDDGQLTLQQALARVRQDTLEHVMERMQELLEIDNESLEDVKSMEEIYDEVRADAFYQRLFEVANVHTAERFDLDVPEGAYERLARAIDDDEAWAEMREEPWFQTAQAMSEDEAFFHWELEYPEVFFDDDGEKRADAGFDAVIGNPPYVQIKDSSENYLRNQYKSTQYKIDAFHAFIEQGIIHLSEGGKFGYIVPKPWLTLENTEGLRDYIFEETWIRQIVQFKEPVFDDATVDTIIPILTKSGHRGATKIVNVENAGNELLDKSIVERDNQSELRESAGKIEIRQSKGEERIIGKISDNSTDLNNIASVSIGIQAYGQDDHTENQIKNRVFHSDTKETERHVPLLSGDNIRRYRIKDLEETWIDYGNHLHREREWKYFEGERIFIREITGSGRYKIHSSFVNRDAVCYKTVLSVIPEENVSAQSLVPVINSSIMSWYFIRTSNKIVTDNFPRITLNDVEELPIPDLDRSIESLTIEQNNSAIDIIDGKGENSVRELMSDISNSHAENIQLRENLNLNIIDHLGVYEDGVLITDLGFAQPAEGVSDSILSNTSEDYENLRIGTVEIIRKSPISLEIHLTARYKPDNEDEYETDRWGYTETEPLPALEISDLTETEADLIEAFVPVAVDEAGGFANFRETATKTNSPVDRLRKLTLPAVDDVRDGLESYLETKARAEELEAKIEKTDDLIDEIVYELYGLTDEEIAIVEEAVGE